MGGLLDGARNFFRGFAPPLPSAPQRFSVFCPEGHLVSGVRTEGYQALRCPHCGEGVFILPRSPLPEPADAPPKTRSRALPPVVDEEPIALTDAEPPPPDEYAGEDEDGDQIEWLDEPEAPPAAAAHKPWPDPGLLAEEEIESERRKATRPSGPAPAGSAPEVKEKKPEAAPAPQSRPAAAQPAPAPSRPAAARPRSKPARRPQPREDLDDPYTESGASATPVARSEPQDPLGYRVGQWARARRNTLVFLAVATIVVSTVSYRIYRSRLAGLPRVAERGWTEGLPALDAGQFDLARQLLFEARDAVDTLGDVSEHASDIRQGAAEVAVHTQLCPDTLEYLLDQAVRSDAKEWATQFDRLYKGRSVIIDARVTSAREGSGRYEIDYQVLRPGEGGKPSSRARIGLKGFTLLETLKPKVGDRLVFGARLASFAFDVNAGEWLVGLEPESGVTMVHRKALEASGWHADDEAAAEEDRP